MSNRIRRATPDDFERIGEIGADGGSADTDARYLLFVATAGRLLVAEEGGQPVAFGGMVPADGVAMVTDLFVASSSRGRGLGGMVLAELVNGWPQRMTCSSQQPAALSAYAGAGMKPRWRLLYLEGRATGGAQLRPSAPWAHDRGDLVEYFAEGGAAVSADVVVGRDRDGGAMVLRMQHGVPIDCMRATLAELPMGVRVQVCVPEPASLAGWLVNEGFRTIEHDLFCSTDHVALPVDLSCVHPGLA